MSTSLSWARDRRALRRPTAAARGGASVLVVEDGVAPHPTAADWNALAGLPNLRILRPAAVLGIHHDRLVTIHERHPPERFLRDRLWKVRAGCVILATGAVEQPLVMAGNDRPGVMLAEAAVRYLELYGVQVGRRVAVISNNAEGLRAAARLREAGVAVVAVVALGDLPCPPELAHDFLPRPKAISIRGGRRVRRVCITGADGRTASLACDAVLMSGGFQPSVQLWTQAGGRVQWSEPAQALLPVGSWTG